MKENKMFCDFKECRHEFKRGERVFDIELNHSSGFICQKCVEEMNLFDKISNIFRYDGRGYFPIILLSKREVEDLNEELKGGVK